MVLYKICVHTNVSHRALYLVNCVAETPHWLLSELLHFGIKHCRCVQNKEKLPTYFNVSNGVRQSEVLSPKLFSIDIDDLSLDLAIFKSECYNNGQCRNHIEYIEFLAKKHCTLFQQFSQLIIIDKM